MEEPQKIEYAQSIKFSWRWGKTGDEVTIYADTAEELKLKLDHVKEISKGLMDERG